MNNLPNDKQRVDRLIISKDTFCPHCNLIVESMEGDDALLYCSECGKMLDDREPQEYEPEII